MENRTIGVAILGLGTVGLGTWKVLNAQKDEMVHKLGATAEVKKILVRNVAKAAERTGHPELITNDWQEILNDPSIEIVIELMGGIEPARTYIGEALAAGKHVVTANKDLIASDHGHLMEVAKQHGCDLMFEAAVAGAIPVITPLKQSLAANHLTEVMGIVNGTTNFILTRMINDGMAFEDALKLAQDNGYAERDPSADILGFDACRKVCILASLCFGKHVYPDQVHTEGITEITLEDVEYAKDWGGVIKLLGRARKSEDGKHIYAIVSPAFVDHHSQLASVDDVFNAILVRGDAIGDVVFYGRGAGKLPTASAVVGDVIDCARHENKQKFFGWADSEEGYVSDYLDMPTALYVRARAQQKQQVISSAEKTFGEIKLLKRAGAPEDEFAFVTPVASERELRTKLETLLGAEIISTIRVTDY